MSIALSDESPLYLDVTTGLYRSAEIGDNTEMLYTRVRFNNGYECYLKQNWGADAISAEIQNIIDRFDSDNPPTNWVSYA